MLKGFLILIFISSAVALIVIQVSKPPPQASHLLEVSDSEESIDMDNIVFHTLTRPEDKFKPETSQPSNTISASCTTDLDCETTLKIAPFEFESGEVVDSNLTTSEKNTPDKIEEIINKNEAQTQGKDDEILDLIDNLADLQESIEKNT